MVNLLEKVKIVINKVIEEGYEYLIEFEIIIVFMFLYFYNEKVDYGVIEVGFGGRLDLINVLIFEVSVIIFISFDYINILGNILEEIVKEKVGIIKEGVLVVLYF